MPDYEARVLRVIAYIHDNPTADLSLDALADIAAMSRFHWHRVYRAVTGETCAQTVRRMRMVRAAQSLLFSDAPIQQIAGQCGYPNLASFGRAFAEVFGLPPAAFRARGAMILPKDPTKPGEPTVMFPIEIDTHSGRRMAALPHKGAYNQINRAFEQLSGLIGARGLWPKVQGMVAVYYDPPAEVAEAELRSHAGFLVGDDVALQAPLEEIQIPAGRHAVMHFKGPYSGLAEAYEYLYGDWLAESGVTLRDFPSFELYLNSPMDTAPDELLTDIYLPVV